MKVHGSYGQVGIWIVSLVVMAALWIPLPADAVGLGRLRVLSSLDEPLNAEIELLSVEPGELSTVQVGIASRSDYQRAGVERSPVLSRLQFQPAIRADGTPFVRVSSELPIGEPFLHLLVSMDWSGGRLIREYTALLDPPVYAEGRGPAVSSPRVVGRAAAPQAAPEEAVARPSASAAAMYGPVSRGETLSEIALRLDVPEDINVFQRMSALLQANPDAFIRQNINLLREGAELQVPSAAEMAAISKVVASQQYSRQLSEWLSYRSQLADTLLPESPGRASPTAAGADSGAGSPRAGQDAGALSDADSPESLLRIVQSDSSADRSAGAATDGEAGQGRAGATGSGELTTLRNQLAMAEENLLSRELENKELRERLRALEEQVQRTARLLALRDDTLALAQQQGQGDSAGSGRGQDSSAQQAADTGSAVSAAATPVRTQVNPSRDWFGRLFSGNQDLLWKVLLGLAAVVLLIGVMVIVRRRRSYAEYEESVYSGSSFDIRSQPAYAAAGGGSSAAAGASTRAERDSSGVAATSFMTELGAPGVGGMQTDEVDPIAEADVYLAYGRDQQAIEVLQDAIRRDPGRVEFRLKLLEIHHKRKDRPAFESLAEDLHGTIGNDEARWNRVADMGRRLNSKHPLFAAAPFAGRGEASPAPEPAERPLEGYSEPDSAPLSLPGRHFDLGGDSRRSDDPQPAARPRDEIDDLLEADTGEFSVSGDLDMTSVSGPAPGHPAASAADDFQTTETATKLDLARAYLEMGDKEAARGFIDEVLREGNESQRKEASELAATLST